MTTLLRNKTVMGTAFRIFESHLPYSLQVFIDFKIYGMSYINFREVKFRSPLPQPKRRHINLDSSQSFASSQGALNADFFDVDTVPMDQMLFVSKSTHSELELDVDASNILQPASSNLATPNASGVSMPEQMVPSLAYMWDEERKRRYDLAKKKNPGVSPGDISFGLGSMFESSHQRMVEGPHEFHRSILDKFSKIVEKDEATARSLAADPNSPFNSRFTSPGTTQASCKSLNALLSATPHATTGYKALARRAQSDEAYLAASQQPLLGSQVDEDLASSQVSDQSLLEALQWMMDDDWNNNEWESRLGKQVEAGSGYVQSLEEEDMMNDRDIEAIMASQKDMEHDAEVTLNPDIIPPPESREKRILDHEDSSNELSDMASALLDEVPPKRRKRVKFVESASVLHFEESALHPHKIESRALTGDALESEELEESVILPHDQVGAFASDWSSQPLSPGFLVVPDSQVPTQLFQASSQAADFQVDDTQLLSTASSDDGQSPAFRALPELLQQQVLSIPNLTRMASKSFAARFLASIGRARQLPLPSPTRPEDPANQPLEPSPLLLLSAAPPSAGPDRSSGQKSENSPSSAAPLQPPAFECLSDEYTPSKSIEEISAQHQTGASGYRRPMVLQFARPPPSWSEVATGMKLQEVPLIKYQAPFYGEPSDRPDKASKFAGIAIVVEATRYENLPPFDPSYSPVGSTSAYHAAGATRQQVKKRGIRGLPLRALTPARPPPIVHLYEHSTPDLSTSVSTLKATAPEASATADDEEDDEFELISNSPKLAEQFRMVAGVRSTRKSNAKDAQQILSEENEKKRKALSFSQLENNSASQLDRATPSNPHGFALRPEAKRPLGGRGLEGLTILSLEVFSASNGSLRADPHVCPVEAIYYCLRDDFTIRELGYKNYKDAMGVMSVRRNVTSEQPPMASFAADASRREYNTEMELLLAFRDMVVSVDPDLVMGYECQQNSLGYIFERSIHLGIPKFIPSFGRAAGDLGNQFDIDSWGGQHASGISMVGRIVFNVWRIMRSELALQSYSFESIAYHVLHQRIAHFDHLTLTKWYTGLSDLGPPFPVQSSPAKPKAAPKRPQADFEDISESQMNVDPEDGTQRPFIESQAAPSQPSSQDQAANILEKEGEFHRQTKPEPLKRRRLEDLFTPFSKSEWASHAPNRWRVDSYYLERAQCNLFLLDALNIVSRTSEFARMYGITFYSVLSRGSQYRVESLMLRMSKPQNYVCVSPTRQQVAQQLAPEAIPLVMEPLSAFYTDPVLVLDFQSLYPSVMIAYNLCFSTCLGKIGIPSEALAPFTSKRLGVLNYELPAGLVSSMRDQIYCSANGVMYTKPEVRTGTISRMLHEILETRVMIKEAMKAVKKTDPILWSQLDSRQLGLKMIANVTYGYASASFSGRMPCVDVADSIVQTGRETLERAIKLINTTKEWGAKVIYGDTDSVFVLLKGATKDRAFKLGNEIAQRVTDDNPWPVKLKFEKVYHPCVLLAKKRYVSYMYESLDQEIPIFDAKGIETVRRDTCPAVSKILEKSLRMLFESKDMSLIKSYLRTQWTKILTGRISLMDFIFRKEVRLGTYRGHHAPPAALVSMKAMQQDPRSAPRFGERVPYVVVAGTPKSRLIDLVFHPHAITPESGMTVNAHYYITRNIVPVLARVFDLFGVSISDWYLEMPKRLRTAKSAHNHFLTEADAKRRKQTIEHYYSSQYCPICDTLTAKPVCDACQAKPALSTFILSARIKSKKAKQLRLLEICMQCTSNPARSTSVDCDSLDCTVYYQRIKYSSEASKVAAYETLLRQWNDEISF